MTRAYTVTDADPSPRRAGRLRGVFKRGGKGRVSKRVVAAGCAAVLAVYAAGYWRTGEATRRLEARAQERRTARAEAPAAAPPAVVPVPAIEAPAPAPLPPPAAPEARPATPQPARKAAAKKAASPAPAPPVAVPTILSVPLEESPALTARPAPAPESLPTPEQKWRDGTYTGWGQSFHGDIEARVVIRDGRIVEAGIATCGTRYDCNVIHTLINQPVQRQRAQVDNVSGASESSDAYYYGLLEALQMAREPDPATPP
jgi:uncharacterized protein with FMN-binding domain